jgi:UDP-N-acetylmuramoyl-L-alanyl-D-glutamate--2,6-diaminopimelate ligase
MVLIMANLQSLKIILKNIINVEAFDEHINDLVGPLCLDSRAIKLGDTFIAMSGYQNDGRVYIPMAVSQGASLIFAEENDSAEFKALFDDLAKNKIVWITDLRSQLSEIASNYFGHPSHELKNIAVTGTNGKTSCSYLIAKTLQKLHFECYLMGTLGVGCCGDLKESANTTADAITLQSILRDALDSGAQFSSIEISSHGIHQNRATAIQLNTAIFTNLTRDHLDYHGSMENYGEAKRQLFLHPHLKNVVINMDDRFGRKLAKDELIIANKWLVTTKLPTSGSDLNRWIWAEDVSFSLKGIHAKLYTPWGSGKLDSSLIGLFNLSNLLLVVATLGAILKDLQPILEALKFVGPPAGRMHTVGTSNTPLAIVDYAHTPDALENALIAIREHCSGLIYCVFGCGGDRDSGKRPLMAKIAEKLSNKVIVTRDNPRYEDDSTIEKDIYSGFKFPNKIKYIANRKEAIEEAIRLAMPGDAVLIAGKGHEDYQIIGKEKYFHSDRKTCEEALENYKS